MFLVVELICLTSHFAGNEVLSVERWVVGSIPHGGPIDLVLVPYGASRLCNKGRGMCYPVCGMVHIIEPLLLFGKNSLCDGSWFSLSQSKCSFKICPTYITVNKMC